MSLEFKEEVRFWASLNKLFTEYPCVPGSVLVWNAAMDKKNRHIPKKLDIDIHANICQIVSREYGKSNI